MLLLNRQKIVPTIFPDKTSQIWNINIPEYDSIIDWQFESESEIIWLIQLMTLLNKHRGHHKIVLNMSYLPYGRQDKEIENDRTFALQTFLPLIDSLNFTEIVVFDPHNPDSLKGMKTPVRIISPESLILNKIYSKFEFDFIIFPDAGAAARYTFPKEIPCVVAEKVRDQTTGRITSYNINLEHFDKLKSVLCPLVIDDICDGGATFELLGKKLDEISSQNHSLKVLDNSMYLPDLYISHGIFSKGIGNLIKYYRHIFTTTSLPQHYLDDPDFHVLSISEK